MDRLIPRGWEERKLKSRGGNRSHCAETEGRHCRKSDMGGGGDEEEDGDEKDGGSRWEREAFRSYIHFPSANSQPCVGLLYLHSPGSKIPVGICIQGLYLSYP
jgi:hypothetical protein